MALLSTNAKIEKSNDLNEHLVRILHFVPGDLSGVNLCKWKSKQCFATCLFTAGMGKFDNTKNGRMRKAKLFLNQREQFKKEITSELDALIRKGKKLGRKVAVRLNGISDVDWEKECPELFSNPEYKQIQWYDYTKDQDKFDRYMKGNMPKNYYLIFSGHEDNWDYCEKVLNAGYNIALVFKKLPKEYVGRKVINGDLHDSRFKERHTGRIVGLTPKDFAKKLDDNKFVLTEEEVELNGKW